MGLVQREANPSLLLLVPAPPLPPQDSPTNKLLYAKEIPEYRKIVQRYYKQIHDMTPLSEQEMNAHLAEESRVRRGGGLGAGVGRGPGGRCVCVCLALDRPARGLCASSRLGRARVRRVTHPP